LRERENAPRFAEVDVIPANAGIQSAAVFEALITDALEYWVARRSLSSGGALRRPGGGR